MDQEDTFAQIINKAVTMANSSDEMNVIIADELKKLFLQHSLVQLEKLENERKQKQENEKAGLEEEKKEVST